MNNLEKMLDLADAEFGNLAAGGKFKSRDDVHMAYELVDIVKDVYEIWKCEKALEEGDEYSEYGSYGYSNGMSMRQYPYRGYSGARRRDSMGRYSRDNGGMGYRGNNGGGSSYRNGYSRGDAREEYLDNLRQMMDEAPDEQTRQKLQRMIREMEQE